MRAAARVAFAALFAFMSLLHGPIMAAAGSAPPPPHHSGHASTPDMHGAAPHHQHHQHHQHQRHQPQAWPDADDGQGPQTAPGRTSPSCYGIGCFIVLGSLAPPTPAEGNSPIARLTPAIAAALPAGAPDPLVPPPRLPV